MEERFDRGKNRISLFFVESPDFFFMGLQIFLYQGLAGLYRSLEGIRPSRNQGVRLKVGSVGSFPSLSKSANFVVF